ncbi:hypothetical protein [Ulvibacter litoralis]|uniref:Uncharacterized protein n=1 Tax=Ulvibacter litoralis TaxID=227084 RepID=A0A1G7DGB8_9FLAO|nr:hypothetical protein [Ulvibacter litoralis]GHC43796.1 hypothetical protein GCM10008083_02830 [Ulvibacter litoralis]SDE49845.1 hypothetical protein SAMN05421855_101927 [Ulvibacter litoralis]
MKNEESKVYLLKVEYSVIDVKKKKKKVIQKNQKMFMVRDLESLDDKFKELQGSLIEVNKEGKSTFIGQVVNSLKKYGSNCHQTYLSILRA